MSRVYSYDVSTKALIDQGRVTLNELKSPVNKPGLDGIQNFGIKPDEFIPALNTAVNNTRELESQQEQAKAEYATEASEDRILGEKGYRYAHRLQNRVRCYLFRNPDANTYELRRKFRFGKVKNNSPRTVAYELMILLSEARKMQDTLAAYGVTEEFLVEGRKLFKQLDRDRSETDQAKEYREDLTRKVNEAENELSCLLRELEIADQSAAIEHPESRRWFPLDIIAAEKGRVQAAREARIAARPEDSIDPEPVL